VRQFSADPAQNPGGWQGSDWENRGYDVYSFFPEFSPPNCTSCGRGSGDLEVDYQDTLADFFAIANAVQPIAIITFSRTGASLSWELEMNQFNRAVWIDDYVSPRQPTPAPPDDSVPADFLRPTTLPTTNIVNAVNASGLGLNSFLCFSGSGGGFLSEFIAYCGVWYQSMHAGPTDPTWCVAAGHVHVGSGISWPIAEQAAEVTLREVIAHVDSLRTARVCQPDVGFQGPGAADLAVCGDALTTVGGSAEMRLTGGAPNAPAILVLSDQLGPTPLFGGVLAPNPVLASLAFDLDGDGQWLFEGVPTGVTLGISIYAQAVPSTPARSSTPAATPPSRSRSSSSGAIGRAAVPSGASTGENEAVELRDGDKPTTSASPSRRPSTNVNDPHRPRDRGLDARDQEGVDAEMIELDGTPNKGRSSAPTPSSASPWPSPAPPPTPRACPSTATSAARPPRPCPSPC
jgi:hypothetical protein